MQGIWCKVVPVEYPSEAAAAADPAGLEGRVFIQQQQSQADIWQIVARSAAALVCTVILGLLAWGGLTLSSLQSKVGVLEVKVESVKEAQVDAKTALKSAADARAMEMQELRKDSREIREQIQELRLLLLQQQTGGGRKE